MHKRDSIPSPFTGKNAALHSLQSDLKPNIKIMKNKTSDQCIQINIEDYAIELEPIFFLKIFDLSKIDLCNNSKSRNY